MKIENKSSKNFFLKDKKLTSVLRRSPASVTVVFVVVVRLRVEEPLARRPVPAVTLNSTLGFSAEKFEIWKFKNSNNTSCNDFVCVCVSQIYLLPYSFTYLNPRSRNFLHRKWAGVQIENSLHNSWKRERLKTECVQQKIKMCDLKWNRSWSKPRVHRTDIIKKVSKTLSHHIDR